MCACVCVFAHVRVCVCQAKRHIAVVLSFTNTSSSFCSLLCKSQTKHIFADVMHVVSRLKIIDNQTL